MLVLIQVRPNYRTAITIPERFWGRFRDIISDFIDQNSPAPPLTDRVSEDKTLVKQEAAESSAAPSGN